MILSVNQIYSGYLQDHGHWFGKWENNSSLHGEILEVTSLWMACLSKVCQFLECSIDESCNLMILFKPSGHSKLLQMDSFWPELHDHSNGWDYEGSGFSLVLSNGKENREKLFSVVLSNITESPESNLSQLMSVVLVASFHVADKKGKNRLMTNLTNSIESNFLLNSGLCILQFLNKIWDIFLSDLLVVVGAHFTKEFLRIVDLSVTKTGISDNRGKDKVSRSLKPESLLNSLRLDKLENLLDKFFRWSLHVVIESGNNQVAFNFSKLFLFNHFLQEHDS